VRGDEIRARLQYNQGGTVHDIYGPSRLEKRRAQADLEAIRAAGVNKSTRAECIEAMQAEARSILTNIALHVVACIINVFASLCFVLAPIRDSLCAFTVQAHRLQHHAAFEAVVAIAAGKQELHEKHLHDDPDPDSDEDEPRIKQDQQDEGHKTNSCSEESEAEESGDDPFPYFDVSTKEACARLASGSYPGAPAAGRPTAAPSPPTNDVEASAKLAKFRPICETVDALRALLEARADPNIVVGAGQLSPLRNVICFGHKKDVAAMRQLLLAHGARESEDDKKRWITRWNCDINEEAWLKRFHSDDREG